MDDKVYGVTVECLPGWFFFDFYDDAVLFMELMAEDGHSSSVYMRNELGQYERIGWCDA